MACVDKEKIKRVSVDGSIVEIDTDKDKKDSELQSKRNLTKILMSGKLPFFVKKFMPPGGKL
jgi:hypothetical protein